MVLQRNLERKGGGSLLLLLLLLRLRPLLAQVHGLLLDLRLDLLLDLVVTTRNELLLLKPAQIHPQDANVVDAFVRIIVETFAYNVNIC